MAYLTLVVNNGLAIIANLLKGSGTAPKNIGMGTGTNETTVENTGLQTPVESRVVGTPSVTNTNTTGDTLKVIGSIECTLTPKTITEVALFDDISAGSLFVRSNFAGIPLAVGDSINFSIYTVFDQDI